MEFPIDLPGFQECHKSLIQQLINCKDHKFKVEWDCINLLDTSIMRMAVKTQFDLLVWENECAVMESEIDKCDNKIKNSRQLFAAVVLAAKPQLLQISNIKLESKQTAALIMNVTFEISQENKNSSLITRIMNFVKEEEEKLSAASQDNSLEAFFHLLQPPISMQYLNNYTSDEVVSTLAPFQTQNVQWMLGREGHYADSFGNVRPISAIFEQPPLLHVNLNGSIVNQITGKIEKDALRIKELQAYSYRGGVLADEMGLGKTVCVISLLSKHKLDQSNPFHPNNSMFPELIISGATLIIAPGPIIGQWSTEIKKHAIGRSVYIYSGRANGDYIEAEELAKYDVVLTHYETFRTEINHSNPPPDRPRRKAVKYKFKLSPLVSICWFRCVLDEAQMIEGNISRVARMAKMIPRWYSWAVSGTPMKKKYTDLRGIYEFLNIERTFTPKLFSNFVTDKKMTNVFFSFAASTIRRNVKSLLENQIQIPMQYRHVVRVPFSTIEQHYYDDLWRECHQSINLEWMDSINWILPKDASSETVIAYNTAKHRLRSWLLALRQNCIHPSVISNTHL